MSNLSQNLNADIEQVIKNDESEPCKIYLNEIEPEKVEIRPSISINNELERKVIIE